MSFYHKVSEKIKDLKFLKQERGAILVLTALLLPIIFGCVGIGYDIGNLYMHKARLQNVADAAALAGGRAYLDSQNKKSTDEEDKDGWPEQEYVVGGGYKSHGGNHLDADRAADDYINHNIRNLGEKVYSDKYSHYALKGLKKNGESYAVADEIFYRIGLKEIVPLRFLPLLTNKYKETVRAGAVVVLQPGKPASDGGLKLNPNASFSMFSNLFTYSDSFYTSQSSKYVDGWVRMAFKGDMVYTHGANPYNDAYYTPGDSNLERHYYTRSGSSGSNSIEGFPIDDPIINSMFDITKYVPAFKKKLEGPHIDVTTKVFKTSQINNYFENNYNRNSYNNVYHLGIKSNTNCAQLPDGNIEIDFDEELKGEENIPIYIILDETTQSYKLKGTQNTRRPVVIVCLAACHMAIDNNFSVPCFKGIIYNPYISDTPWHFQKEGQSFIGSVIAKKIHIHDSAGANVSFEQKNWLENTGIYVDSDISDITQKIKGDNSNINEKLTSEYREKIANIFKDTKVFKEEVWWPEHKIIYEDVDVAGHLADMNWFNNLSYDAKKAMYQKWRDYYNAHPDDTDRDLLWLWNGYFTYNGESEESETNTPETLRLINYRTEYQTKADGSIEEGKVLDPFIFETLGAPNSY